MKKIITISLILTGFFLSSATVHAGSSGNSGPSQAWINEQKERYNNAMTAYKQAEEARRQMEVKLQIQTQKTNDYISGVGVMTFQPDALSVAKWDQTYNDQNFHYVNVVISNQNAYQVSFFEMEGGFSWQNLFSPYYVDVDYDEEASILARDEALKSLIDVRARAKSSGMCIVFPNGFETPGRAIVSKCS